MKTFSRLPKHPYMFVYNTQLIHEIALSLAIQGKLVSQDFTDHSAEELLKTIESEKKKLLKEGKIKKIESPSVITEVEMPYKLPMGWEWVRLVTISNINGGFAFKSTNYMNDGVRVIRISDFNNNGFIDTSIVRYAYGSALDQFEIKNNDILMAMTGGTVGKTILVQDLKERSFVNQRVAKITISNSLVIEYIYNVIKSALVQRIIHDNKNSTNDNISMVDIQNFPIPLPPLAEQKRIVEKVDELMALCDTLDEQKTALHEKRQKAHKAALDRLINAEDAASFNNAWKFLAKHFGVFYSVKENVAELRKTILQLAVMGKLSFDTRSQVIKLKEVIKLISGQHLLANEQNINGKGIPYFTGPADFREIYPAVSRWTECPKVIAKLNDILITVKGAGVGKTNLLNLDCAAISRQLMAVRVEKADRDYIHICLRNAASRFQSAMTGIAIPGIGRNDVLDLEVYLPPLLEQKRIVTKVDSLMAICDELEKGLDALEIQRERISRAALKAVEPAV